MATGSVRNRRRILRSTRDYLFALIFSLAWCIFYPAWRLCLAKVSLAQIMSHRLATIDWPYSSALHGVGELLSALIFVWLGLFLYLILRVESASDFSALRLLASLSISLSISLNILFVVMVGVRIHLKSVGTGLGDLGNAGLIANAHLFSITLPLTLSLFSAAVSVLPGSHGHGTAPLPD